MNYRERIKHIASGGLFVNVYDINEEYGGPEEGGWSYTSGQFLEGRPVANEAEAQAVKAEYEKKYGQQNASRRPYGSVMLNDPSAEIPEDWEPQSQAEDESHVHYEGKIEVYIEDEPGHDFPTERPRYE